MDVLIGLNPLQAPYDVHTLPDQLDGAAALALELALRKGGARVLIVDFTKVTAIGVSGILGLTRLAGAFPDRRIVLASLSFEAMTIAQVTYLHDLFDIYASVDAAIGAILESPLTGAHV